jgi:hypothetical protein
LINDTSKTFKTIDAFMTKDPQKQVTFGTILKEVLKLLAKSGQSLPIGFLVYNYAKVHNLTSNGSKKQKKEVFKNIQR